MRRARAVSLGWSLFAFWFVTAVTLIAPSTFAQAAVTFSPPQTILSGLTQPAETATSPTGDVYFTQFVATANAVTISQLAPGGTSPIGVYQLVGSSPYVSDIHFDPAGNLIFITSVATGASTRQWALIRLNPETGVTSQLVATSGNVNAGPGYSGMPLLSGTEIVFDGVDGSGTIYFVEQSGDPATASQVFDLLSLAAGASAPHEVKHFADPSGTAYFGELTVAKTGDVYFNEDGDLYQLAARRLRVLISAASGSPVHSGLDAAGNLYVVERTFTGRTGYGCATSTTMRIVRISARSLVSAKPKPVVISRATYDGYEALWIGSSSFFRVSVAGDVYWVQSPVDCASLSETANDVIGVARHQASQSLLYGESGPTPPSPAWDNSAGAAQGPIGLAPYGVEVFISSTSTGDLLQVQL